MSWSDRRQILAGLAAVGLLAGCGFQPAYAPGQSGDSLRGQILPKAASNKQSFIFVDRIEDRLGRNDAAPYQLNYSMNLSSEGLAKTPSNSTYRYHLKGRLTYSVVDRNTNEVLTSGMVRNFTGYSAIGTTVATRASQTDARERLMILMADEVVSRLYATAPSWLP
ncbi:LPS assembly lipoprotein LptE [Tropicimonas sp. TH_r6]|uniref:LPS assembly lipoprotein LptE n=1 Tax=Tropicimonas sp. TH_r6 TaxID=3082085 RepID=UPI0029533F7F|nr:LPS assembly lipoprotein LptE [Tropicimonas sp. TH_r6]MDV7144690.1 LPS assembly lipoprotein LptE [Tropicimonas sp. TH_r6]